MIDMNVLLTVKIVILVISRGLSYRNEFITLYYGEVFGFRCEVVPFWVETNSVSYGNCQIGGYIYLSKSHDLPFVAAGAFTFALHLPLPLQLQLQLQLYDSLPLHNS